MGQIVSFPSESFDKTDQSRRFTEYYNIGKAVIDSRDHEHASSPHPTTWTFYSERSHSKNYSATNFKDIYLRME